MKQRLFSLIKFFLGWPLSILAIFFLVKLFASEAHGLSFSSLHVNPLFITFALLSFMLYFLFRSIFWQHLLKAQGHVLSLAETAYLWSMSELQRYIPGSIWSILGRTLSFGKKGIEKKTVALSWVYEAQFVTISGFLLSLFSLHFILFQLLSFLPDKQGIFVAVFCISVLGLFLFLANQWVTKRLKRFRTILPSFSFQKNCYLLFLMLCSFVFFGLGSYFSIQSFTNLPLQYFDMFIGFFVFSFFIGYVTLIFPMGLGPREAIMTTGLIKYMSLPLAGVGVFFSRILLTVAEMLFLLISFLVHKMPKKSFEKIFSFCATHKYFLATLVVICLYIGYFTTASFLRYDNFFTGRFDLGNMDQTVWNTLHGRIFELTNPDGTNIISRLAIHADYILVLLAPFYYLWQDPRMLLLIQTIVIGCGGIFVYLLGVHITKNKRVGFVFAFLYLLYPPIEHSNLYDFHGIVLATTCLLGAFYFLKTRKDVWFLLFLVLAGITKEDVWLVCFLFGVYAFFIEKRKILGGLVSIVSLVIFYFVFFQAIPLARHGQHFALAYYSDFGDSPLTILKTILLSPQKTFSTLFTGTNATYVFELFFPVGFLLLLSPLTFLFALPDLGINLLSNNTLMHQIFFQYTADITPFLFISSMYGFVYLQKKFPQISTNILLTLLLLTSVLASFWYGPLPFDLNPNIQMFINQQANKDIINSFLSSIPRSYSIAATNNIGSHLSHRQHIYTIPIGIDQADVVVFLLNDQFAQPSLAAQIAIAEKMKRDKNYIEVIKRGAFVVFEKRDLYLHSEPRLTQKKLFPFSIEALQQRDFVGGQITTVNTLTKTPQFTTQTISYPSDGLILTAVVDVPTSIRPKNGYPVIILNRGYINQKQFISENAYRDIADTFTSHGFLVIRPDYRGNGSSETDTHIATILAYPLDVLNLVSSLPTYSLADSKNVFLWGHSVGAEIVLATLEAYEGNPNLSVTIKAASIWAPVIDPATAYTHFQSLGITQPYQRFVGAEGIPTHNILLWQSISPLYYLNDISQPLRIAQGTGDTIIPYTWAIELYEDLKSYEKNSQLILYPDDNHSLSNNWKQEILGEISFFQSFIN